MTFHILGLIGTNAPQRAGSCRDSAFKVNGYASMNISLNSEACMTFTPYLMKAFGKCGVGKSLPWIWL
jgi:hypothetical protein